MCVSVSKQLREQSMCVRLDTSHAIEACMCAWAPTDDMLVMSLDMCIDMYADMCVDMCAGMREDIDLCAGMCKDMCMRHVHRHV